MGAEEVTGQLVSDSGCKRRGRNSAAVRPDWRKQEKMMDSALALTVPHKIPAVHPSFSARSSERENGGLKLTSGPGGGRLPAGPPPPAAWGERPGVIQSARTRRRVLRGLIIELPSCCPPPNRAK